MNIKVSSANTTNPTAATHTSDTTTHPLPDYVQDAGNETIWGNLVDFAGFGVLFIGKSGSGKSDISLRIIEDKTSLFDIAHESIKLVADDRVIVKVQNNQLMATPPDELKGKLEIHGLGIYDVEYKDKSQIKLIVELAVFSDIKRLPNFPAQQTKLYGVKVPYLMLNPFSQSSLLKLKYALGELNAL